MTSRENVTSVPHAVHLTLQGLTQEQIQHVARECGYAVPTVYQWGEFNDAGEPRMKIPAAVVPAFCRATKDPLVWETAVLHCHGRQAPNTTQFKRASTLAEAEGME